MMSKELKLFFCEEINASVTANTCESRKRHAKTAKTSYLSPAYLSCKACERTDKES